MHEQSKPITHIFAILNNNNHNFVFAGPKQLHALRCELYDTLVDFFPPCMTQPRQNLIDLIKAWVNSVLSVNTRHITYLLTMNAMGANLSIFQRIT